MKNIMTILGAIIIVSFIMVSCGQNSNKQKELELRERELALKEKELALKEKNTAVVNKSSSPKLTGKWFDDKNSYWTLTITQEEDMYIIAINDLFGGGPNQFAGKYEDGIIKTGQSHHGDFTYSKEQDKLFFSGHSFTRKKIE